MSADPTGAHRRYFKLILDHGTPEEKQLAGEVMRQMRELRALFPESAWAPLETVTLPAAIVKRCERVARERQGRAEWFHLENYEYVERTLEEEVRTTEAQYAACLMLNQPFDEIRNHSAGRAQGNIGKMMSVNCPRPGNFGLTIRKGKPPTLHLFLVYQDHDSTYTMQGWTRAGAVMLPQFEKDTWRADGHHSRPWVVPADQLRPLQEWFDR